MLWRYAKHRGAKAAGFIQGDYHLTLSGKLFAHAVDQMDFCAHGKLAPLGRLRNHLNQAFRRTYTVSLLANLPAAFWMDDHLDPLMQSANPVHVLRQEALVHRTMPLPQNYLRLAQSRRIYSAANHKWVPHHALLQRNAHGKRRVAAQVLVRQKQDFLIARKSPLERRR